MRNFAGLYLHIPFCVKKCAYCDFYSAFSSGTVTDDYTSALKQEIKQWGGTFDRPIDTIYIGGGTPSVLGSKISAVLDEVYKNFAISKTAEITTEVNPDVGDEFLVAARQSGVNRISLGAQSGDDTELKTLGRTHTAADTQDAVKRIRKAGFENLSLDLMLCLPESDEKTLTKSMEFIHSLSPQHISAYMLKIEPNTMLAKRQDLKYPNEDMQSHQYLLMCDFFEGKGYNHYEISNFAQKGFESRHNLKYWRCEEYLGIGPSAHSFLDGRRFYYPRDLKGFIACPKTVFDGQGGSLEEKIMLALRLKEGIDISGYISDSNLKYLKKLEEADLINLSNTRLSLTNKGMLVSNSIITGITELIYENI